jgi:hypothetical protein
MARCRDVPGILALAIGAAALAGCGVSGGVGSLMVDPARYAAYNCKDLVTEWGNLANREKELRGLIDKANESSGGTVIGAFAYRSDYETVLARQKLVQGQAAEEHCQLVTTYSSDQTIR